MELKRREIAAICNSKWTSLGERVAKLKDGESIVLEAEADLTADACLTDEARLKKQAGKIRSGLNGMRACRQVRRTVKVVDGKIVITRVGIWPMLSAFKAAAPRVPAVYPEPS